MADLGQIPEIPVEIDEKSGGGGRRVIVVIVVGIAAFVIGGVAMFFAAPPLGLLNKRGADETIGPIIGPDAAKKKIDQLTRDLNAYKVLGGVADIQARFDELAERQGMQGELSVLGQKLADMGDKEEEYDALTRDLEDLNERVASSQEALEDKERQKTEADSRLLGLRREIVKLEELVGKLEVADARRQQLKSAFARDVEQLAIQIRKSNPLVPPEYRKDKRLEHAQDLRGRLEESNWLKPELLEDYTQLYLEELQMANLERYFLAKIPVKDEGKDVMKWAECVSLGPKGVLFETLDHAFTGVCRNTNTHGSVPHYEIVTDMPRTELMRIRDAMVKYRPENFEERVKTQLGDDVEIIGRREVLADLRQSP